MSEFVKDWVLFKMSGFTKREEKLLLELVENAIKTVAVTRRMKSLAPKKKKKKAGKTKKTIEE